MSQPRTAHPTAEQRLSLVRVVLDLADDFGYVCAVALVDADGRLLSAERPPELSSVMLDGAVGAAREALAGAPIAAGAAAGMPLADAGRIVGAIGVSGGPDGFATEAVTAAAEALRLTPSRTATA